MKENRNRGLVLLATVFFLAQLAALWFLDKGQPAPQAAQPALTKIVWVLALEQLGLYRDPASFVLAAPDNFSGKAWRLNESRTVPKFEWTEPLRFLAYVPPKPFALNSNSIPGGAAVFQVSEKSPPEMLLDFAYLESPPGSSRLLVNNGLSSADLRNPPQLPAWASKEPLTNSVVRVGVLDSGEVFSAQLLGRSGSRTADDFALISARSSLFRLQPPKANGLRWGTVTFLWQTILETNKVEINRLEIR